MDFVEFFYVNGNTAQIKVWKDTDDFAGTGFDWTLTGGAAANFAPLDTDAVPGFGTDTDSYTNLTPATNNDDKIFAHV